MTASKSDDKSGRAATLIPYARSILQAMKENGYRGTVWDDVLNEYEKATAPLPETQHREGDDHPGPIASMKDNAAGQAGREPTTAPSQEGHAAGPAPAAPATPRTDAQPKAQYRDAVFQELVAADFARQLEREVIAWQRQAKAMARAADNEKRRADAAPLSAIGQRTELTGGGSASLNGWPGNRGTAPQGVQECRENSGAADGGERPAPLSTIQPSLGEQVAWVATDPGGGRVLFWKHTFDAEWVAEHYPNAEPLYALSATGRGTDG